jgi:trehalose utilization protein
VTPSVLRTPSPLHFCTFALTYPSSAICHPSSKFHKCASSSPSFRFFALAAEPKPIRVLVWDEQQPQQSQGYGDKFLGETLATELAKNKDLVVKTARLADADQGLSDAALDQADVLVFWCHRKVKEQDDARVEAIVKRVQAGKLGFIALHSAHWAKPFVRLMQERSKADALKQLTPEERASAKWVFVNEAPYYKGVKAGAPMTPSVKRDGNTYTLTLPQCVFPVLP